jgi:hypothetical protein
MPPSIFDPDRELLGILEDLFGPNRIIFGPLLDTDEKGIPYIDDWYLQGLDLSDTDLVCWINADIIVPKGWLPRVDFVYSRFSRRKSQFAVISRRCDFNLTLDFLSDFFNGIRSLVDTNPDRRPLTNYSSLKTEYDEAEDVFAPLKTLNEWPPNYDSIAATRALHTIWGMDTFLVSKRFLQINFDEIPPFHMGRYRWDPWITGWMGAHLPVVTLGEDFCNYHIDHVPTIRDVNRPKVRENIEYGARHHRYLASNGDSAWFFHGRFLHDQMGGKEKIWDWIPKANAPSPPPE